MWGRGNVIIASVSALSFISYYTTVAISSVSAVIVQVNGLQTNETCSTSVGSVPVTTAADDILNFCYFYYSIYPKYWDTLTPFHTCPKI